MLETGNQLLSLPVVLGTCDKDLRLTRIYSLQNTRTVDVGHLSIVSLVAKPLGSDFTSYTLDRPFRGHMEFSALINRHLE